MFFLGDFHHEAVVERRQGFQIERLGALIIRNRKTDMVDHQTLRADALDHPQPRNSSVLLRVLPRST